MASIGLLDIPPEIQLQIAEFAETQDLKVLSLTSRSLCSIAQSMLFETLRIDLRTGLRRLVDNLLANPRICAAIRFLVIHGWPPLRNHEELLSHTQKMLPEMIGLREVSIEQVDLSKAFLNAVLGIAANKPLQISLGWNTYPYSVIPMPHTPLQISHLVLRVDLLSLELFRSMLHASATTLTGLRIVVTRGDLERLADVNLPFLHDLSFLFIIGSEDLMTSAAAFITAQKSIKKLELRGSVCPLPPIPPNALPNALPNLRELIASPKLVNQLVPGQPVEAIEVIFLYHKGEQDQDWFGEEVTQSTARVRMLRIPIFKAVALDTRMVKRMVAMVPFLEDLWLPVCDDIVNVVDALNVVEVLTSLKCLKSPGFELVRREVWVDLNVNDIAFKLRNANSCFSYLEIRDRSRSGGSGERKLAISVWNEVFGMFQRMESATARYY